MSAIEASATSATAPEAIPRAIGFTTVPAADHSGESPSRASAWPAGGAAVLSVNACAASTRTAPSASAERLIVRFCMAVSFAVQGLLAARGDHLAAGFEGLDSADRGMVGVL
jgi:hypothetical protein